MSGDEPRYRAAVQSIQQLTPELLGHVIEPRSRLTAEDSRASLCVTLPRLWRGEDVNDRALAPPARERRSHIVRVLHL